MSFEFFKFADLNHIQAGPGFSLHTGIKSEGFTITYISLDAGRDPSDPTKAVSINPGYFAVYMLIEGEVKFKFYNQGEKEIVLKPQDVIRINPEMIYEITGTGQLAVWAFPGFDTGMYREVERGVLIDI